MRCTLKTWMWLMGCVVVIGALSVSNGCGPDSVPSTEVAPFPAANHVNLEGGYAWMTQVAELTHEDIANLNDEVMDVILATGWTRTLRGFERSKLVEPQVVWDIMGIEFIFEVDDREITIAEDGSISMDMVPTAIPAVRLFTRKGVEREEYTSPSVEYSVFTDRNGRSGIEIASFRAGPRAQEYSNHHHGGDSASSASLPCIDYNGRYGNCTNYSSGWRKYVNFILSDCDYAWGSYGYCWYDHGDNSYCNGTTRNCSSLIGHSSSHHCH